MLSSFMSLVISHLHLSLQIQSTFLISIVMMRVFGDRAGRRAGTIHKSPSTRRKSEVGKCQMRIQMR